VVYAKWILADEDRRKAFRKTLPRRKQRKVYQAAIQLYMRMQGDKQWLRKQLAVKSMVRAQRTDLVVKEVMGKRQGAMSHKQGTMSNRHGTGKCIGGGTGYGYGQHGLWTAVWQKEGCIALGG
jgi:hypothetical protein